MPINTNTSFLPQDQPSSIVQSRQDPEPEKMDRSDLHGVANRGSDAHTPYMVMSVRANHVRMRDNIFASVFSWLTLAGFVTLPNTFTSLRSSHIFDGIQAVEVVQDTVQNAGLLPMAGILCIGGMIGTFWLWWAHRKNYVWLCRQLFWQVCDRTEWSSLISFLGLVCTIIS